MVKRAVNSVAKRFQISDQKQSISPEMIIGQDIISRVCKVALCKVINDIILPADDGRPRDMFWRDSDVKRG